MVSAENRHVLDSHFRIQGNGFFIWLPGVSF
jgi:hypothetical protein